MKRFRTKNKKGVNELTIVLIIIFLFIILNIINKRIANQIKDLITSKMEEKTNLIIKNNIVPKNVDLNKLIIISKNNNDEIIYSDINMNYANQIMVDTIKRIQEEINKIDYQNDRLMHKYKNNYYMEIPILYNAKNFLVSSLGPKIPIMIDLFEHGFGNIDLEVSEYGINNAIVKAYLTIDIEQKIYFPYKKEKYKRQYKLLIASKIINGTVPSIYGTNMLKSIKVT